MQHQLLHIFGSPFVLRRDAMVGIGVTVQASPFGSFVLFLVLYLRRRQTHVPNFLWLGYPAGACWDTPHRDNTVRGKSAIYHRQVDLSSLPACGKRLLGSTIHFYV